MTDSQLRAIATAARLRPADRLPVVVVVLTATAVTGAGGLFHASIAAMNQSRRTLSRTVDAIARGLADSLHLGAQLYVSRRSEALYDDLGLATQSR